MSYTSIVHKHMLCSSVRDLLGLCAARSRRNRPQAAPQRAVSVALFTHSRGKESGGVARASDSSAKGGDSSSARLGNSASELEDELFGLTAGGAADVSDNDRRLADRWLLRVPDTDEYVFVDAEKTELRALHCVLQHFERDLATRELALDVVPRSWLERVCADDKDDSNTINPPEGSKPFDSEAARTLLCTSLDDAAVFEESSIQRQQYMKANEV